MLNTPGGAIRRTPSGYALSPYSRNPVSSNYSSFEKDHRQTSRPPWQFRMNRRIIRQLKRYAGWSLLLLVLVVLWRELGLSARGDDSTSTSRFSRIRGRGAKKRDLRHRSWPGWDGIRKIYALYGSPWPALRSHTTLTNVTVETRIQIGASILKAIHPALRTPSAIQTIQA